MEKVSTIDCLIDVCSLTEDQCKQFLMKAKWGAKPACPHCQSKKIYFVSTRNTYKCPLCDKQFSLTQGTLFENSNLKLKKWFVAIFLMATEKRGLSSIQLAKHIKVQQRTAWLVLQKIRSAMEEGTDFKALCGIVEIDEAFYGPDPQKDKRLLREIERKKEARIKMEAEGIKERRERIKREKEAARKANTKLKERPTLSDIFFDLPWANRGILFEHEDRMRMYQPHNYRKNIVGAVERNIKDVNGKIIAYGKLALTKMGRQGGDINSKNMYPFLWEKVHPASFVMTDDAKVYSKVSTYFESHKTIKHRKAGVPVKYAKYVDGNISTNVIEGVWAHVKRTFEGTYISMSWKYTTNYLNEFAFRYNRRHVSIDEIFSGLLQNCVRTKTTLKKLQETCDYYKYHAK